MKDYFSSLRGEKILAKKAGANFIVIEGLDGSGQTTQAELLRNFLLKKGLKVVLTKEPTFNSQAGKKIRKILNSSYPQPNLLKKEFHLKLQELFARDREEHLKKVIIPALKKGKTVISDRYFFSSFAYGKASGLSLSCLIKLNTNFLMPDLTIILKVSPEICLERIKKRDNRRTLFEKKESLNKTWQVFKNLPKRFKNVKLLNGELAKKVVFANLKKIVLSKINLQEI